MVWGICFSRGCVRPAVVGHRFVGNSRVADSGVVAASHICFLVSLSLPEHFGEEGGDIVIVACAEGGAPKDWFCLMNS